MDATTNAQAPLIPPTTSYVATTGVLVNIAYPRFSTLVRKQESVPSDFS